MGETLTVFKGSLLALMVASFLAFAAAYCHPKEKLERVELEELVFSPVKWDGICPQKAKKCPSSFQGTPPLLMVSLDGFHPDYLKRGFTPTIENIAKCGTSAKFMYPVFPSKTFPNHFSQVTGLNPPSHGIIDNFMYDPVKKESFHVGRPGSLQKFWWKKEPIWITAEKQGKKTACFFWPSSDVEFGNIRPTYYRNYSGKVTFEDRVDQVLQWLDLPVETRPRFLNLYFNQPDNAGHWYGFHGEETNQALIKVDNVIARLFAGLQKRNLVGCVNVIISSDHGMSDIDCKRIVEIHKYINVSNIFNVMGPIGRLRPENGSKYSVKDIISELRCRSDHMRAYAKEQLPVRMHYADNQRIEPIFLDLDVGWNVVSKDPVPNDEICTGGTHGYDNLFPEMRAIFMAHGPSFKENMDIKPFISTELYEMLAELIDVVPNPNNGTRGSLHHMLKSPRSLSPQVEPRPPARAAVPKSEKEYDARVNAAKCSCSQAKKQRDVEDIVKKNELHLPFGVPYSSQDNSTLRLLYNDDYIAAFDLKYRLPMWTAFTVTGSRTIKNADEVCWKGDARIFANTSRCDDYNTKPEKTRYIIQRPLFPPAFSSASSVEQATYVTNSVPKSLNYTNILEKKLNQVLSKWSGENGQLNVITGPAFDLSATGLRPQFEKIMNRSQNYGSLTVPTHIFVIATWCSMKVGSLKACDPSKLEVNSFLLPNDPYPQNCETAAKVIQKNVARVVDIENLTGISFFTGLPIYDAIRLRTWMPERHV